MFKIWGLITLLCPQISFAKAAVSSNVKSELLAQNLIFLVLGLVMYFYVIKPQSKHNSDHSSLLAKLSVDDEVITQGGLVGKVTKLMPQFIIMQINDNSDVVVQKTNVVKVLPKGTIKNLIHGGSSHAKNNHKTPKDSSLPT